MRARDVVPSAVEPRGSFLRRRKSDPALPPPAPEPVRTSDTEELLRAEETLLQAALRQAQVLEVALANEQHLRRQETEQLHAELDLLRATLATLNAEAIERQHAVEAVAVVPEQRQQAPSAAPASAEPDEPTSSAEDGFRRHGRRRSGRQAGPA